MQDSTGKFHLKNGTRLLKFSVRLAYATAHQKTFENYLNVRRLQMSTCAMQIYGATLNYSVFSLYRKIMNTLWASVSENADYHGRLYAVPSVTKHSAIAMFCNRRHYVHIQLSLMYIQRQLGDFSYHSLNISESAIAEFIQLSLRISSPIAEQ